MLLSRLLFFNYAFNIFKIPFFTKLGMGDKGKPILLTLKLNHFSMFIAWLVNKNILAYTKIFILTKVCTDFYIVLFCLVLKLNHNFSEAKFCTFLV